MNWGRRIGSNFLNTKRVGLEDEPVYSADYPRMLPVKTCPFERGSGLVYIDQQLIHRPANPLLPDDLRKVVTYCSGP